MSRTDFYTSLSPLSPLVFASLFMALTAVFPIATQAQSSPASPASPSFLSATVPPPSPLSVSAHRPIYSVEINGIRGFGTAGFGSKARHDLLLIELGIGYSLTRTFAPDSWWGGSLEGAAQVLSGAQDSPHHAYLVGINPGLRYYFHTESRWKPYFGLGAGVMLTDIEDPDLSLKFQFFEHAGPGLQYQFTDSWSLNVSYRFMHISNAGLESPNRGVNSHLAILGASYHF